MDEITGVCTGNSVDSPREAMSGQIRTEFEGIRCILYNITARFDREGDLSLHKIQLFVAKKRDGSVLTRDSL